MIRQSDFGFHLPQWQWSLLNRFWAGEGDCGTCRKQWGLTDNEKNECSDIQTVLNVADSCLLTKFDGGLQRLHTADKAAVNWLTSYDT